MYVATSARADKVPTLTLPSQLETVKFILSNGTLAPSMATTYDTKYLHISTNRVCITLENL